MFEIAFAIFCVSLTLLLLLLPLFFVVVVIGFVYPFAVAYLFIARETQHRANKGMNERLFGSNN